VQDTRGQVQMGKSKCKSVREETHPRGRNFSLSLSLFLSLSLSSFIARINVVRGSRNNNKPLNYAGRDKDAMKGWLTKICQNWKPASVVSIKSDALRIKRVKRYQTFPSYMAALTIPFILMIR